MTFAFLPLRPGIFITRQKVKVLRKSKCCEQSYVGVNKQSNEGVFLSELFASIRGAGRNISVNTDVLEKAGAHGT
jgi:hypothetical protein